MQDVLFRDVLCDADSYVVRLMGEVISADAGTVLTNNVNLRGW